MARPIKEGLDYFALDIDFFHDQKIEFVSAKYGIEGEIIAIKLLCKIYRNGYYLNWGDDECLLFSKKVGENISSELVKNVVDELLKRDFFSQDLYKKFNILTSKGIQKRYFEAIKRRKNFTLYNEYCLLNGVNVYNNLINVDTNPQNVDINTQSKVKESKVKEIKEKNKEVQITNFKNFINNSEEKPREEPKKANHIEFDFEMWSWHGVDEDIKDRWVKIFPNVDVEIELNKMREYFKSHPGHEKMIKEKFSNNYANYIFDWLARAEKWKIEDLEKINNIPETAKGG